MPGVIVSVGVAFQPYSTYGCTVVVPNISWKFGSAASTHVRGSEGAWYRSVEANSVHRPVRITPLEVTFVSGRLLPTFQ